MNQARERHGSACVDGHIYVVGGLMAGKACGQSFFENFSNFFFLTSYKAKTQTWSPERCWAVQPDETDVGAGEELTEKVLLSWGDKLQK